MILDASGFDSPKADLTEWNCVAKKCSNTSEAEDPVTKEKATSASRGFDRCSASSMRFKRRDRETEKRSRND